MGLNIEPWTLPMNDKYIVVPVGWERTLLWQAAFDPHCARAGYDRLLGREVIWVETLGL